jgi:serine/threonine protein kinase
MLHIKKDIREKYTFDKGLLGEGRYGKVFKGLDIATNDIVAIKTIEKSNITGCMNKFLQEIQILKICIHPHIVRYIDCYEDESYLYIVMEYIKNGDLLTYILKNKLSEKEAKHIFVQLLSAIIYCHGHMIAHRDLKLENIVLSNKSKMLVKLIDFGLANFVNSDALHTTKCGSLDYISPEIITKSSYNPLKADIWSLGVVLYGLITKRFPFDSNPNDNRVLMNEIINFRWKPIMSPVISSELQDLFEKIFVDVSRRITLRGIQSHPWLKNEKIISYLPEINPIMNIDCILIEKVSLLTGNDKKDILYEIYENKNTQSTYIYHTLAERFKVSPVINVSKHIDIPRSQRASSLKEESFSQKIHGSSDPIKYRKSLLKDISAKFINKKKQINIPRLDLDLVFLEKDEIETERLVKFEDQK